MRNLATLLIFGLTLTGCLSTKTYVDPNYGKSSYSDIVPVDKKYNTTIVVEFQRNGVLYDRVNQTVRNNVERTLRATGVIVPSSSSPKISIEVTVNNLADMSSAAAKGFGVGLTFGAVGNTVTDYYEITIAFTDENGAVTSKDYKHALHTTIGNEKAPIPGITPTTTEDGFATVIEQVLLNFITDMQKDGKLSFFSKNSYKHT